jgi:signal transduction histidine kinase
VLAAAVLAASFLAMGAIAWRKHPGGRVGLLAAAVGVLSLLEPLAGPQRLLAAGWATVLIHLVAALPSGRLGTPAMRLVVALAYLNALFMGTPVLPYGLVKEIGTLVAVLLGAAVLGVQWMRWRRTSVPGRRSLTPVLAAALVMVVLLLAANPLWTPEASLLDMSVLEVGFVAVPLAYLATELRTRIERGAVADLVVQLGSTSEPASLRSALARALHDPTLSVGYWVAESRQYVDADGRPVAPPAGPDRVVTRVDRGGEPVALLVHDPALLEQPRLIEAACTAAALALQNERLTADLRARLVQLAESRRHVVQAAEAERRRLERDLHDGVQQRLLAIPMTLSVAASALTPGADRAAALIAEAKDMSLAVLDELRALSQGIHPTILTERGLEGAVRELTAVAPVPVRLTVDLPAGLSAEIETTAYYVVAEALANVTKHAEASRTEVRIEQAGGRLVVEVVDDGRGGADPAGSGLRGLAMRAEDNGGILGITSPVGGGTRVRAELPCE